MTTYTAHHVAYVWQPADQCVADDDHVTLPDAVAHDQRAYDGAVITVQMRDGSLVPARLRGDLYDLHGTGTGDPIVELL